MFYENKDIELIKKENRKYSIISSILGVFGIAIMTTLFFFTRRNLDLVIVINSIVSSLLFVSLMYIILNIFVPNNRRLKILRNILGSNDIEIEYDEAILSNIRTINHEEKVYELTLIKGNKRSCVFLDTRMIDKFDLIKNSKKIKTRFNYVVEIL